MVQFCNPSGADIRELIDAEAEREAAAALRLQRRTGARERQDLGYADDYSFSPAGLRNVFRQFKYNRAATIQPGKAVVMLATEADHKRRAERRERIALQARLATMTAHLPPDKAREVCRDVLAKLGK